jgi:transcription elongation factor GreA
MDKKPQYLSKEKLIQLQEELENLKTTERKAISQRLEEAKKLGDLSENAEYTEAKEAQENNEQRIMVIEQMLKDAVVIDKLKSVNRVNVGSTIEVKEKGGDKIKFIIVGSEEVDPLNGKISNESPLGQAFLGRKVGEIVEANTPSGVIEYKILNIS